MTPLVSDIKQLIPTLTRIDECLAYFDSHVCKYKSIFINTFFFFISEFI